MTKCNLLCSCPFLLFLIVVSCVVLNWLRSGDLRLGERLRRTLPRMALASAVMGAGLYWAKARLPDLGAVNILMDFAWLIAVAGAGFILYVIAATLLRAYDPADIGRAFSRSAKTPQ